jgi:hypothetical protein
MGSSPEPAVPAYRSLRMRRKRPQVLGGGLKSRRPHLEIVVLAPSPQSRLGTAPVGCRENARVDARERHLWRERK